MDTDSETVLTFPNEEKVPLSWRDDADHSAEFQKALKRSHTARQRPTCGCLWNGSPLEIVLRHLQSGRYIVACKADDGLKHEKDCAFHRSDPNESGQAAYVSGVIEEKDGITKIRLENSLKLRKGQARVTPKLPLQRDDRADAKQQRAMTPLGLLHLLWREARFNYWKPGFLGKRTQFVLSKHLEEVAQSIECGGIPLSEQFAMIQPKAWNKGRLFQERAKEVEKDRYFVIAAVIDEFSYNEQRGRWDIKLVGGLPAYGLFLSCNTPTYDRMMRSFQYPAQLLETPKVDRAGEVVGLFVLKVRTSEKSGRTNVNADVFSAGLMVTTDQFIPVESGLERQVAETLVQEQRVFEKPLRFDASEDLVFPDFKLLDTDHPRGFPMEVFGRSDEAYEMRREAKQKYYNEYYGQDKWWRWIASGSGRKEMPLFEPATKPAKL